jgi:hypothetical protein
MAMTKEEHLKQYEILVRRHEKAAASMEHSANTMVGVIKAEREITKHQYALVDDLMGAISGVNELSKGFAFLLSQTSVKLMEKNIHQLVDEHKEQEERAKKFSPGVPKEVLKKAG